MGKGFEFDFKGKKAKKNLKKGFLFGTAAGAAIGATLGLLFAPKKGKEFRNDIKEGAYDAAKKAASGAKDTVEKIGANAKKLYKKLTKPEINEVNIENVHVDQVSAQDQEVK